MRFTLIALPLALATSLAIADGLPPPSRTVFKCEDGKRTYYSDSPCLGAQKLDVTPTRGMNKSTGRELVGTDVAHEQRREQLADGIKPLTGMNPQQLDQFGRRMQLSGEAQQACRKLDQALPMAEQAERAAQGTSELQATQLRLLRLRQQFRDLRCQ